MNITVHPLCREAERQARFGEQALTLTLGTPCDKLTLCIGGMRINAHLVDGQVRNGIFNYEFPLKALDNGIVAGGINNVVQPGVVFPAAQIVNLADNSYDASDLKLQIQRLVNLTPLPGILSICSGSHYAFARVCL